ncbi:hypothetical protein [Mesorhizobium sp.]|uniref:hypothetical protein n=1 Tax=Mesorhizobium sp. TaxID=1871066 RepID=UPI000FE54984|nr:hypothetical protein [Mesorhizobium sp.]RWC45972.1 MAG: hypothetical protein EOS55_17600 [Mesorhizobium sp.]RWC55829.1 MAG: hypothetical protein EOS56_25705 [Mesorhizobium sp.]RWC61334.1 MAG: hypothetical protein EOS29_18915 [Mesorhizobium sp.]
MAQKARKPAPAKGKATQSKAGAGPAITARSKDAKPTFGKAAPKKVVPAAKAAPKTAKPKKPANAGDSLSGSAMRTAKATANVAAGAVMVAARGAASLAASVMGKGGSKAKAKAK